MRNSEDLSLPWFFRSSRCLVQSLTRSSLLAISRRHGGIRLHLLRINRRRIGRLGDITLHATCEERTSLDKEGVLKGTSMGALGNAGEIIEIDLSLKTGIGRHFEKLEFQDNLGKFHRIVHLKGGTVHDKGSNV